MMKRIARKLAGICILLGTYGASSAVDNAHFYKTARFHAINDRDVDNWHSKVEIAYGYGSAKHGYDLGSNKKPILDIHGDTNLLYLSTGVPKLAAVTSYFNLLMQHLNVQDTYLDTGKLEFRGKFSLNEVNLAYRQNLASGVFVEAKAPIRNAKLENINFRDKTPSSGAPAMALTDIARVVNNLNVILNAYGIKNYETNFNRTSLGDVSLLLGWQHLDQGKTFEYFKFFTVALRAGALFPSGIPDDTAYAFSIPTGHNEHWGITARGDVEAGVTGCLTWGAHLGAIFFFDRTMHRRMKTHVNQSGFIKLASGRAKVSRGVVWDIGSYFKADHFFQGLSGLIGYSFNRKENDTLTPQDSSTFSASTVNSDSQYAGWHQHAVHVAAEYDFGVHVQRKSWKPVAGLYYDFPLHGRRIFATDMLGGSVGLHLAWKV